MFVLQCCIKSGVLTNSLLAMHPAVQHMVLDLMNINAAKWEWSLGTGLMAGKLPHMILLFRKFSFICFSSTLFSHWGLAFCRRNLKHAFKSWKCLSFGSMIPVLPGPNTMLFSSHQLITPEDSLHLHASYPGVSFVSSNPLSIRPDVSLLYLYSVCIFKFSNRFLWIQSVFHPPWKEWY